MALAELGNISIDPTTIKNILSEAEDTRVALKISDYQALINDNELLKRRIDGVRDTYFDLQQGQQCIRDLFICLHENCIN